MPVDIMLTVVFTSIIQSVFGAGVLLFGTPLLLLFGHGFVDTLVVLLPISIGINLLQIAKHHAHIDFAFFRNILVLSLPLIAVFLFLVTHAGINISLLIGLFLLFIACKEFSASMAGAIDRLMAFEKPYFLLMGIVHGLSNLGGSLLTALVHHKQYEKDVARVTVASSYATFAVVQLLTLRVFSRDQIDVDINHTAVYMIVGSLIFMLTDEMFYSELDRETYQKIFAVFLAISGVVLVFKSLV
ncbi:MAG: TSUP family transporter [Gammaproteobacteria bacterium]